MSVTPHWSEWPKRELSPHPIGYIYVIEFSLGVVKVGKTDTPQARALSHERSVSRFGHTMTRWWLSPGHRNYAENEAALIAATAKMGTELGSAEYFSGCHFSDVVATAAALPMVDVGVPLTLTSPRARRAERRLRAKQMRASGETITSIAAALDSSLATVWRDLNETA